MNKAQEFLSRINSPGIVGVLRCDNENGRFIDYVDANTRESVAYRLELADGTVQVIRAKRGRGE